MQWAIVICRGLLLSILSVANFQKFGQRGRYPNLNQLWLLSAGRSTNFAPANFSRSSTEPES